MEYIHKHTDTHTSTVCMCCAQFIVMYESKKSQLMGLSLKFKLEPYRNREMNRFQNVNAVQILRAPLYFVSFHHMRMAYTIHSRWISAIARVSTNSNTHRIQIEAINNSSGFPYSSSMNSHFGSYQ